MERLEEGTLKLLSGEAVVAIYRNFYEPLFFVVAAPAAPAAAVFRNLKAALAWNGEDTLAKSQSKCYELLTSDEQVETYSDRNQMYFVSMQGTKQEQN